MNTNLIAQVRKLSLAEQIDLVEVLWGGIAGQPDALLPTDAQRAELDRRLADHRAHPDDVLNWSDVKAAARARLGR